MLISGVTQFVTALLLSLGVTIVATPFVKKWACRWEILDTPGERRVHRSPVPRGGGIAVFIGFHTACALLYLGAWQYQGTLLTVEWWLTHLLASTVLLIVGLVDDVRGITPVGKLCGQIVASLIAFQGGANFGGMFGYDFPYFLDLAITLLWYLSVINAFNLIDGLDGLASGLCAIAALGIGGSFLFRELPFEGMVMVCLIGSAVGFLRYNINPAQIFLGDAGSMFLGFTLASVTAATVSKGVGFAALVVPLLAIGVPACDTLLAVWRRVARKSLHVVSRSARRCGVMDADMEHLHHRLFRTGLNTRDAAASLYLVNAALVLVGIGGIALQDYSVAIYVATFVAACFLVLRYVAQIEVNDSRLLIRYGMENPWSPRIRFFAHAAVDIVVLSALLLFSIWVLDRSVPYYIFVWQWIDMWPEWCGLPLLGLLCIDSYRCFVAPDRGKTVFTWVGRAAVGVVVVLALTVLVGTDGVQWDRKIGAVYFLSAAMVLTLIRVLPYLTVKKDMKTVGIHVDGEVLKFPPDRGTLP